MFHRCLLPLAHTPPRKFACTIVGVGGFGGATWLSWRTATFAQPHVLTWQQERQARKQERRARKQALKDKEQRQARMQALKDKEESLGDQQTTKTEWLSWRSKRILVNSFGVAFFSSAILVSTAVLVQIPSLLFFDAVGLAERIRGTKECCHIVRASALYAVRTSLWGCAMVCFGFFGYTSFVSVVDTIPELAEDLQTKEV